jgi:hypothetical protein
MTGIRTAVGNLDWRFLVAEFLIVVVGILAAFAWDGWWERRGAEAAVVIYLDQIAAELLQSEAELEGAIASTRRQLIAAAHLTRAAFAGEPPAESELRTWADQNSYYTRPVLTMGTARAMVSTGDISLVPDRGLRTRLVSAVDAMEEYQAWSRNQITQWLLPAWHEFHPFVLWTALQLELTSPDSIDARARVDSTYMLPPGERVQPFPVDIASHVRDPGFHAVMLDTYVARNDLLNSTEALLSEFRSLRVDIERWLEERR